MMTPKQTKVQREILSLAHFDFQKGLNAHAYFKTHNHETGQDLVQDTFMKTWSYLVKGGKIEVMKAFLYHVLNHLIVDEYRKHKTASLDALTEKGFDPSAGNHRRIFESLDGKSAILLIAHLPEKYQKIMRMRFVQDLSLTEMALITGQSKNAMAVQVHRGLDKLKLLYEPA